MEGKGMVSEKIVVAGLIRSGINGEDADILQVGDDYSPLAERLDEICGFNVTVRYWISDKAVSDDERIEATVLQYTGSAEVDYRMCYSEYTGYLWTNEELKVGNHDLLADLYDHVSKWLYLEIIKH